MVEWLGRPFRSVPRHPVPPLRVSIPKKVKEYVEANNKKAGTEKGKFVVIHGIELDSKASMQGIKPAFVIPHEEVREDVEDIVGDDASSFHLLQLASMINDSAGVIATNTVAIQLANARDKPSIILFSSEEKGKLFVPNAEGKKCVIISSQTGKLVGINVQAIQKVVQTFEKEQEREHKLKGMEKKEEPEIEELAEQKERPEVEGRRPRERRDREERDELNELEEVRDLSHCL
ncbi:hypothetical protein RJ641_024408 [Dillenia turbinata]|uniref:Uncharacterized protein n=1 Tax=Dillenia turbinata TaxID=194707 RepID=A0AAN8YTS5_9MAGN